MRNAVVIHAIVIPVSAVLRKAPAGVSGQNAQHYRCRIQSYGSGQHTYRMFVKSEIELRGQQMGFGARIYWKQNLLFWPVWKIVGMCLRKESGEGARL